MEDVTAVTRLIAAGERADVGTVEITRDDVHSEWARPSFDPRRDALLLHDGGRLVAEAEVYRARRAQVAVHPSHRGRGLGSALLGWTEHTASAQGGSKVGQTVADATPGASALFESRGYAPQWTSWILSIVLTDPLPAPTVPPEVAIRSFRPEDAEAIHAVIEEAFGEWPDRDPTSLEDWAAVSIRRPAFRPELLRVAVDDRGHVVGTALCIDEGGDEGWVQQLAVRRPWRGRGLGRALLQDSFRLFRDLGRTTCGLNTDSRTGALGLYEHIGMRVTRSYTHWAKDLRPEAAPEPRLS
jgi:GNAT superfamily N-acetyltransferase